MSDDLITWLRTQLEGDERVARQAVAELEAMSATWQDLLDGLWKSVAYDLDNAFDLMEIYGDPTRVLAEVAAKRAILAMHGATSPAVCDHCSSDWHTVPMPCPTTRLLALPYADREGYRDEWAVGQ